MLVYNAGQADEGMMCTSNLLDLERVGSDENTHVICKNYRSAWWPEKFGKWHEYLGARTYEIGPSTESLAADWKSRLPGEVGHLMKLATTSPTAIRSREIAPREDEVNMGQAETLRAFLLENIEKYPAKHYAVIISGHGSGFAGQTVMHNPEGRIPNAEIGKVLEEVGLRAGHKIDVVNLNTCNGAGLEVFHALRNGAQAAVSSQGVIFGATQPLGNVLQDLQKDLKHGLSVDGAGLARKFVQHARYQELSAMNTATLSAVDLSKMDQLGAAVGQLHSALMDEKIEPTQIARWMEQARRIEYSGIPRLVHIQDVGAFAALVAGDCPNEKVRAAAEGVSQVLAASVIEEEHADHRKESPTSMAVRALLGKKAPPLDGSSGVSIYYDSDVNARGSRLFQVKDSDFGAQTQIEKFLQYVSQPADADRAAKPWWQKKLEHFTYEKRILEYKLDKKINIPMAMPLLKRAVKTGAMIGASALLSQAGLPMHYFWGAYFAYQGAEKVVKSGAEAASLVGQQRTPQQNLQLVDNLADLAMGACLTSFGMSVAGLLPTSIIMPAAALAMSARAGRYLGQVAVNKPHHEAHRAEAQKFLQSSLSAPT